MKRFLTILCLLVGMELANPYYACAQSTLPPSIEEASQLFAQGAIRRLQRENDVDKTVNFIALKADNLAAFAVAISLSPNRAQKIGFAPSYIASVETRRTDKQLGSSGAAPGSTSAVSKPSVATLLGMAIDRGAINQDISGSVLTFSSSPYALIASIKGDTAETYNQFSGYSRLGLSASFNLQNSNDPLANATRKQLTEWSARFRVFGDHSGRSALAQAKFRELVLPKLQFTADLQTAERSALFGDAAGSAILLQFGTDLNNKVKAFLNTDADAKALQASITAGKPDNSKAAALVSGLTAVIDKVIQEDLIDKSSQFSHDAEAIQKATAFLSRYQAANADYSQAANTFDEALKELENLPTLSLVYAQERGSGTPDYSVAQLIYEKKPKGFMQIDANINASFYHRPDRTKNEQTFRDLTVALSLQQGLGKSPFTTSSADKSEISLSFAGRYERMQENRHVPGKKADIGVANVKLEIPVAAGVSFPVSITFANASELIKESDVRGNFGISFDLDKLSALVKSK